MVPWDKPHREWMAVQGPEPGSRESVQIELGAQLAGLWGRGLPALVECSLVSPRDCVQ